MCVKRHTKSIGSTYIEASRENKKAEVLMVQLTAL